MLVYSKHLDLSFFLGKKKKDWFWCLFHFPNEERWRCDAAQKEGELFHVLFEGLGS